MEVVAAGTACAAYRVTGSIHDRRIFGIVITAVVLSGMEVGFCHPSSLYFTGIGNTVAVGIVTDSPFIGIEGHCTIIIPMDMVMLVFCKMLCDLFIQIDRVDVRPQANFVHQLHGNCILTDEFFHPIRIILS